MERIVSVPSKALQGTALSIRCVYTNKGEKAIEWDERPNGYPHINSYLLPSAGRTVKSREAALRIQSHPDEKSLSRRVVLAPGQSHSYEIDLNAAYHFAPGNYTFVLQSMDLIPIDFPEATVTFQIYAQ